MRGHNDNVDAVVWSPDGKRLASASLDNSVRIWDPVSGEETLVLRSNAGMFYDVSWNPDGAQLAAACSDGQIWIWDATPGFKRNPTVSHVTLSAMNDLAASYNSAGRRGEAIKLQEEVVRLCRK